MNFVSMILWLCFLELLSDTKRFANRSKTSFYPGSQNILLIIGLTEETRLLPTRICLEDL